MFDPQIIINIISSAFIYIIVALSFTLIYYPAKFFHIAHAATISFGAFLTFFIFQQCKFPIYLAIPISIGFSILIGILMELIVYKPLRRKNVSTLLILIASLGLYVVLQNFISLLWGDDTKSIRTGEVTVGLKFLGVFITSIQMTTISISAFLFISIIFFLKYYKIGKNIRAISANAELAKLQGINTEYIILWSFAIGSGIAALAGILVSFDTGLTPTMGFNLLLYGIVAVIIGGVGNTWGLIGGAFLIALVQHITIYYIDSKWMDTITYLILILFLIWKPLGFSGKRLKKIEI